MSPTFRVAGPEFLLISIALCRCQKLSILCNFAPRICYLIESNPGLIDTKNIMKIGHYAFHHGRGVISGDWAEVGVISGELMGV
jgi:hypothetical protein